MELKKVTFILILVGFLSLIGNFVGPGNNIIEALPGMTILIVISIAGVILAKFIPGKIPSVAYIVLLGCMISYPGFPGSEFVNASMQKVNFLALTTPILAYAGISIGKDLDSLKKTGWKIVIVSCVVFVGTYIGSSIIAQIILKMIGQI